IMSDKEQPIENEQPSAEQPSTEETAEAKVEEAAVEKVEEKAEETAEEKAEETAEEKAEETAKEKAEETAEEKAEETAEEKAEETAEEKAEETAEEKAEETAEEKTDETAEQKADETAEEKTDETAEEKAEETAEKKAEETAEAKAEETTQQKTEPADLPADEAADAGEGRQDPPGTPVPAAIASEIPRAPTLPEERAKREAAAAAATAASEEPEEESEESLSALKPVWAFGMNRHVPVISLATSERDVVFYACANSAVLYDVNANRQRILRGHTNAITCTAASNDKRWLVTGDAGLDSAVIIWDSRTAVPVRTMFEPHPNGVYAVALNPNSRFLCTLSAEANQTFAIWNWTTGEELSLCSATLSSAYGIQRYISFNADDNSHVVTNSDHQVLFFQWGEGKVEYFAPPLTDKDFNKPVGRYCHSVFLRKSTKAISATSQGLCVVWDSNKPLTKMSTEATPDKRAVKLVPLHEKGITVLTQTDEIIVTGDTAGHVKFFDQNLQLLYWYQHFKFGPVSSISFKYQSLPAQTGAANDDDRLSLKSQPTMDPLYDTDATIPANPFFVRDFVIGTSSAVFANVDVRESRAHIIHRDFDAAVRAIDVHPTMTKIAIGGKSGYLKIWNYQTKLTECSRHIEGKASFSAIRCIKFDPAGEFLAVGHEGGLLRILDADTLSDVMEENFHYSRECITHIVFSDDSRYLATADKEFTTSLYERERGRPWTYVGRHRAHYKEIHDLLFGVQIDTGYNRLLSLGKDRYLVEYDIPNASKDNLPVLTSDRIEQNGVPLCMTWYPPIVKEQFLLTANDEYKYKLYNCTTKKCRNTFLGPTYGSPVRKICILPHPNAQPTDRRYAVFMLNDKIGLTILPLDGNPYNSVGCVAHPQGVANMACSADGRFLFTAGGEDATVQMWSVHPAVLDAQSKLGGPDLIPFYSLLEGGREGELFKELEDYFYYAQLRAQGIDSMETRWVSERIPIAEIPFVMRGLGFYPSEQEIDNMMNEIKFSRYVDTGEYVTDIDLGEFIRLYVNHRPVFGLSLDRIFKAFKVLGEAKGEEFLVDRGDILDLLQNSGEHMTEYELAEYLTTLLGFNPEGGSFELEEFNPATAGDLIDAHIPARIGASGFVEDLLGFGPVAARQKSSQAAGSRSQSARPKSVQISSSEAQTL
ncbi:hypothetical protein BOX15_Mlig030593g1, partial [Macrostomum lignano]